MADSKPETTTTDVTTPSDPPKPKWPPLKVRRIDRDHRERKLPMRVLVLGLCRTGTSSIIAALRKLGYTPHQMREVLANPSQIPLWQEAIDLTLVPASQRPRNERRRLPFGRDEFDKLLGEYDAVTDVPAAVLWKQLIEAYPEAKVILTNRPYDEWERSMQNSIFKMFTYRLFYWARVTGISRWAPVLRLLHTVFYVHNGSYYGGPKAKKAYEQHYENVRAAVPADRLLELGPEQGWDPLCEFLGKKKPKETYPLMKENETMTTQLEKSWQGMMKYLMLMVFMPGGAAVVAFLFIYWRMQLWGLVEGLLATIEPYARLS